MLGALSRHLPIEEATLLSALSKTVPTRFLEINRKAFELGKIEVE
jgi:indolepyruvate ferredoxin oxidoreductase beta subunit